MNRKFLAVLVDQKAGHAVGSAGFFTAEKNVQDAERRVDILLTSSDGQKTLFTVCANDFLSAADVIRAANHYKAPTRAIVFPEPLSQ